MIRRSVRRRFHNVYWIPPSQTLREPCIFVPNHHGWFDGYLMFNVVSKLGLPTLDWIQEFDAFPLFAKIGGMPYPLNDIKRRAATVKRTIRLMREDAWSLLLFAEAHLHYPPDLLEFGKALETVAAKVPGVQIIPVAIQYEMAMHERPEAFITFGEPVSLGDNLASRTRLAVQELLTRSKALIRSESRPFEVLAPGTPDVNERWDLRKRLPKSHR
jgi:1-acyl-sn-glycerol-3-phosphate acyltransferase